MKLTVENVDISMVVFEPADQLIVDTSNYEQKIVKVTNNEQFDVIVDVHASSPRVTITPEAEIIPSGSTRNFTVKSLPVLEKGRHHAEVMMHFKLQRVHESPYEPLEVAFIGQYRDQLTYGVIHYKHLPMMFLGYDNAFWFNSYDEYGNMQETCSYGVRMEEENIDGEVERGEDNEDEVESPDTY